MEALKGAFSKLLGTAPKKNNTRKNTPPLEEVVVVNEKPNAKNTVAINVRPNNEVINVKVNTNNGRTNTNNNNTGGDPGSPQNLYLSFQSASAEGGKRRMRKRTRKNKKRVTRRRR